MCFINMYPRKSPNSAVHRVLPFENFCEILSIFLKLNLCFVDLFSPIVETLKSLSAWLPFQNKK